MQRIGREKQREADRGRERQREADRQKKRGNRGAERGRE
jgi:hypothetical protein